MQRMSDMLTRWLDGNLRRQEEEEREDEATGRVSEAQTSGGQDVSGERSGDVVNEAAPAAEGSVYIQVYIQVETCYILCHDFIARGISCTMCSYVKLDKRLRYTCMKININIFTINYSRYLGI